MSIGERIKYYRNEKKLTQEYLAEKMGVTRQAVSKWENDKALPNMENLVELANIFGIPLSELTNTKEEGEEFVPQGIHKKYYLRVICVAFIILVSIVFIKRGLMTGISETTLIDHSLTFSGYTGYLDECKECGQSMFFKNVDYDEDNKIDRVYRTAIQQDKAEYKIEFGNGDILQLGDTIPDGGFPYILSCDFTGDDRNDIVFGVTHGDSTDPQACGETAFYVKTEDGYEFVHFGGNDVDTYINEVLFYYEKADDYTLKTVCPSTGFETLIEIDREIWDSYQYEDTFVGQKVKQCIYKVEAKQNNDGTTQLIGRVRLLDKWNTDEVLVIIQYKEGRLTYVDMYQENMDTTPLSLFHYDVNNVSKIDIINRKTGEEWKLPENELSVLLDKLNASKWIKQQTSAGILDCKYIIKVYDGNGDPYFEELIFRDDSVLNINGYLWVNTSDQIPFNEMCKKE